MKNNKMSTLLNSKKKAIHYSRSSSNREVFFTGKGGGGWWNTLKIRSDTNVLNKYSRVIDDAVKLIHTHSKYKAIKVHVNIRYYKYMFTQTEITK